MSSGGWFAWVTAPAGKLVRLVFAAGLLSAWLARRAVARPLVKVTESLGYVQRFELEKVRAEPSHIAEVERLSGAIADMASGLSAFRKYIPADLVRTLVAAGDRRALAAAVDMRHRSAIDFLAAIRRSSRIVGERL